MGLDEVNYAVQNAAMIATKSALNGNPLEYVQYVPAQSATQSYGIFVTRYANIGSASLTPPWDK